MKSQNTCYHWKALLLGEIDRVDGVLEDCPMKKHLEGSCEKCEMTLCILKKVLSILVKPVLKRKERIH